jgi:phosphopantetheinyl transferase
MLIIDQLTSIFNHFNHLSSFLMHLVSGDWYALNHHVKLSHFDDLDQLLPTSWIDIYLIRYHQVQNLLLMDILSKAEQQRASAFANTNHQSRFIVTRGVLRSILARYTQTSPSTLLFSSTPKPYLLDFPNVHFNLSHSGDYLAVAVSTVSKVGIDIQLHRPVKALAIAKRYFHPEEYQALYQIPEHYLPVFFEAWSAKEAYLKYQGVGLSGHLAKQIFTIKKNQIQLIDLPNMSWQSLNLGGPISGYVCANSSQLRIRIYNHQDILA